jgi:hypothetical protein
MRRVLIGPSRDLKLPLWSQAVFRIKTKEHLEVGILPSTNFTLNLKVVLAVNSNWKSPFLKKITCSVVKMN